MQRRIYLSLERARDLCVRNLLRKVWLLEGGRENTRVKIGTFATGMRFSMVVSAWMSGSTPESVSSEGLPAGMEDDEVECLIAGLIYKVRLHTSVNPSRFFKSPAQTTNTYTPHSGSYQRLHLPRTRHRGPQP